MPDEATTIFLDKRHLWLYEEMLPRVPLLPNEELFAVLPCTVGVDSPYILGLSTLRLLFVEPEQGANTRVALQSVSYRHIYRVDVNVDDADSVSPLWRIVVMVKGLRGNDPTQVSVDLRGKPDDARKTYNWLLTRWLSPSGEPR